MDKIAIIGANEAINQLILKSKMLNFETHVFAWQVGDVGEKTADYFYPISINNKEEILEICKKIKPVGVITITSDYAIQTANFVARGLGLICNNEQTELLSRNKYFMRKAFKDKKLYTPWFKNVTSIMDICIDELTFPLIVKPTDRWSSKGVCRVNKPEELSSAIMNAVEVSLEKKAIIESYMEGPEYSCECISYAGKHTILAFTKKYTSGSPNYIEIGHIQPSDLSSAIQKKITSTIFRALDALKIEYGASHVEFKVLNNGEIGIIEVGARMGGDCIGTDLVQISTGYDYIKMAIDVSTGKKPTFERISEPKTAVIKYVLNKDDVKILSHVRENYPQYLWRVSNLDEVGTRNVTDSSTRFGYFILSIENSDDIGKRNINNMFSGSGQINEW